ncbi:MAG TPA: barstar family protein [Phototrophicaceae bacterium]|nr:barstar family protein [Phototrophicaceae bacterium]
MPLTTLFSGETAPGLYRLKAEVSLPTLEKLAQENNFTLFVFSGKNICNQQEFFDHVETVLKPANWGRNWDSFEEVLNAVYKIPAPGVIVLYNDFQVMMAQDRKNFDIALDIIMSVSYEPERLKDRGDQVPMTPLYLLLQGETNAALPIDWL